LDLSGALPREDRLTIEGRYYEAVKRWPKAIEVYKTLWMFSPDNLDYGLRLAQARTSGGQAKDALATLDELRSCPRLTGTILGLTWRKVRPTTDSRTINANLTPPRTLQEREKGKGPGC